MCAILDANVVSEVFGKDRSAAGAQFFKWITTGRGQLVVGGKLFRELIENNVGFRQWAQQAIAAGRLKRHNDSVIQRRTSLLERNAQHNSNDPHILALAQISGARLLYSNDLDLRGDFANPQLVNNPRGKIYSTLRSRSFGRSHRSLLSRRDLCR